METLLANVAADADLLSISCRTESSGKTIIGLGSLSGKAIQAVGELAVRGMGGVNIWRRIRAIGSQIRSASGAVPKQVIEDLLELQRVGLYSNAVRSKAWALILWCLYAPGDLTSQIIQILLEWPTVELQLFLRQLMIHRLYGWASVSESFLSAPPTWKEAMFRNVARILHAVLEEDPSALYEVLDINTFLIMQTDVVLHSTEDDARCSLAQFFNYMVEEYFIHSLGGSIPAALPELALFLSSNANADIKRIVDYVTTVLSSYARPHAIQDIRIAVSQHPELARADILHPTLSFLLFSRDFCTYIPNAMPLFIEAGLVDIIGDLCALDFPDPERKLDISQEYIPSALRLVCCILLALVYEVFPGCVRHLRHTNPSGFFDIFPWMMDYCHTRQGSDVRKQIQGAFYDELFELYFISADPLQPLTGEWIIDIILSQITRRRAVTIGRNLKKRGISDMVQICQELIRWRLSSWTTHSGTTPLLVDYSDHITLNYNLLDFLAYMLEVEPSLILSTFGVQEFRYLLPPNPSDIDKRAPPTYNPEAILQTLAASCRKRFSDPTKPDHKSFLGFLSSIDSERDYDVLFLDTLLDILRPFAQSTFDAYTVASTFTRFPTLDRYHPVHPTYPFLLAIIGLCDLAPQPPRFLSLASHRKILEDITFLQKATSSGGHVGRNQSFRDVILRHVPGLRSHWQNHRMSGPVVLNNRLSALPLESTIVASRIGPDEDQSCTLVVILSEPSEMSVKNEAMRALLCYAALPETQWTSIITAFRRMQPHELSNLFFTAGRYIDSFWDTNHSTQLLQSLRRLTRISSVSGDDHAIVENTVDRLKRMFTTASEGDEVMQKRIAKSGILNVVVDPPRDAIEDFFDSYLERA